jgi:hypothetical protein
MHMRLGPLVRELLPLYLEKDDENRVSDVWDQPGNLLRRSALLYGVGDAEGGALLFEKPYAMPDLPVRLRPEELEVGMEVDILPYQKTGVAPLGRRQIIQLNGCTMLQSR